MEQPRERRSARRRPQRAERLGRDLADRDVVLVSRDAVGPNVTTTSGSAAASRPRTSAKSGSRGIRLRPPSGCRRNRRSGSSPRARHDSRSSASRTLASVSRVASDASAMRPASPLVARITVSSRSSSAWSARLPASPKVSSSGCAKTHATRRTRLRQRRQVEQRLEPDREPGTDHHGPGGHQHARHERGPVGRVVPDRERLPLPPKMTSWCATSPGRRTECTRMPSTSPPRTPSSDSPSGPATPRRAPPGSGGPWRPPSPRERPPSVRDGAR
jgi:hypothetical protein